MASCLLITSIICVLLTTVAAIVAFATPNWIGFRGTNSENLCGCQGSACDCGLWLFCTGGLTNSGSLDNCRWFFSEDFRLEKALPDWFKAVQGLFSCAIASSLLSLLIGLFSLCCYCKTCNAHQIAGAFINLTFLLLAIAVCVFGAKSHMINRTEVIAEAGSTNPLFGWSFWVGVGASGMALISSIMYFCVGRHEEVY